MADEKEKNGAHKANDAQSQLEDFARAQMKAAQAAADAAKANEASPEDPAEKPAVEETQNGETVVNAQAAETETQPQATEDTSPEPTPGKAANSDEEPAAETASEEEPVAQAAAEEKPVAKAGVEEEPVAQAAAEEKPAANAADNKEAESGGAETSEYDDLEKWAAEQLAAMEGDELDETQAGGPAEDAAKSSEAKDEPPADPAEMSPEEMEKWAAAQLATMEEDEAADASSGDAEPVETALDAVVSAASPGGAVAPVLGHGGGFHLRPLHAAVFVLAATLPAALTGWILSSRTVDSQRAITVEVRKSMDEMEKRLALLKARELNISVEKMTQRLTVEDLGNFVKLGDVHLQEGHISQARRLYESAIEGDKAGKYTDGAHYGLGLCFLKSEEPEKASSHFRTVITRYPGSRKLACASVELGALLMKDQNYTQARRLYYHVIGCKDRFGTDDLPHVEQAYYAIAKCYEGEAAALARLRSMSSSVVDTGIPVSEGK